MDNIISFDPSAGLCPFCGERSATRLCDAPIGVRRFVGHPPRHLAVFLPSRIVWEIPMVSTLTCDRPICESCATRIGAEIDYCPDCMRRIVTEGINHMTEGRNHGKTD